MHGELLEADLSERVIGAGIEVHKQLGPGLLESAYEACLCHELDLQGIPCQRQVGLPLAYKGMTLEEGYRMDVVVDDRLVLEIKSVREILPIHEAQLLTYLRLSRIKVCLLMNFHVPVFTDGLKRRIL